MRPPLYIKRQTWGHWSHLLQYFVWILLDTLQVKINLKLSTSGCPGFSMFEGLTCYHSSDMKLILIIIIKDLVDKACDFNEKFGDKVKMHWINPFVPNAPFLYPMKLRESRKFFWCFLGIEWRCIELTHSFPMHPFSTPWNYQKTVSFSDVFWG